MKKNINNLLIFFKKKKNPILPLLLISHTQLVNLAFQVNKINKLINTLFCTEKI